jgi:hypothetical protein
MIIKNRYEIKNRRPTTADLADFGRLGSPE